MWPILVKSPKSVRGVQSHIFLGSPTFHAHPQTRVYKVFTIRGRTWMFLTSRGINWEDLPSPHFSLKRSTSSASSRCSGLPKVSTKGDIKWLEVALTGVQSIALASLSIHFESCGKEFWGGFGWVATLAACVMGGNERAPPSNPLIGLNWERIGADTSPVLWTMSLLPLPGSLNSFFFNQLFYLSFITKGNYEISLFSPFHWYNVFNHIIFLSHPSLVS